ncbi:hypothetical protein DFH07DRAFT_1066110 [Mycena maculata]|uniref:F-box domain-containing protein n=1 Tax=Mycena maculata TaxID=230809 RepID=A0AAD7HYC3_9AGAR|nr:hypothetical protein DFH07DRAFT_1066110 [Mycena maculata]
MQVSLSLMLPRIRGIRRRNGSSFPTALPLELQLLVLDEISDNNPELQRLCRVCRAWGAYAQTLIFREVWVTEATVLRLVLLFETRPQLGNCTTTLRIVEERDLGPSAQESTAPVLSRLARRVPDLMPNLRTLHFIHRKSIAPPLPPFCAHALSGITNLRLSIGGSTTPATLPGFIAHFSRLEGLEFPGSVCIANTSIAGWPLPPRSLKRLDLGAHFSVAPPGHPFSGPITEWLSTGVAGVTDLSVASWYREWDPTPTLLTNVNGSLRRLRLQERSVPPYAPLGIALPLSVPPFPILQHFEMNLDLSTRSAKYMELGLLAVLHQLSSPHLSTIYLETYVRQGLLDLPWDDVDMALQAFGSLREVVFDLWGMFDISGGEGPQPWFYPSYRELCRHMRRKMRLSDSRGILTFRCAGGSPRTIA